MGSFLMSVNVLLSISSHKAMPLLAQYCHEMDSRHFHHTLNPLSAVSCSEKQSHLQCVITALKVEANHVLPIHSSFNLFSCIHKEPVGLLYKYFSVWPSI